MKTKLQSLKRLSFFVGDSFSGIRKFEIVIENNKQLIRDNGQNTLLTPREIDSKEAMNTLISNLTNLNFDNWDKEYVTTKKLLEPVGWKLSLRFINNEEIEFSGVSKYPENWTDFINLINTYTTIFSDVEFI